MSDSIVYRDLAYVFGAALLGGLVARRLRQPLIIGYVIGGILIGPFTPGPTVSQVHFLELLAEVGVILLMYSISIEFSIRDLLDVKWVSLVGGPLGILAIVGLALAGGRMMGWTTIQSVAIGAAVSLASTMVLTRLLMDRGELHSEQGRAMVGITLVDDLVFVVMTVLLLSLGTMSGSRLLGVGLAFGQRIHGRCQPECGTARWIPTGRGGFYPGHMWKADHVLFPLADDLLSEADQGVLVEQFSWIESAVGGDADENLRAITAEFQANRKPHEGVRGTGVVLRGLLSLEKGSAIC